MKVFWDPDCLLHNPPYEILSGDKIPYIESPARLQLIKKALEEYPSLFSFESATGSSSSQDRDVTRSCEMVHSREYLNYLSHAYDNWVRTGGSTVTERCPPSPTRGLLTIGVPVFFCFRRPCYLKHFLIRS
jgi:acetoin utilization deacetylase AcuC-like enzyme